MNPAALHKVIFYPVQNGDTSQVILNDGRRLLFDFHHQKIGEDESQPVINLKSQLQKELQADNRNYFDVVAFTHGDQDHIRHSTEFFELNYSAGYQGNERIKIKELWVPAAMILETATNPQQSSEFVIWRQEARHRLREGKGIRVFSKPEMLKDWLSKQNLTLESRRHLITNAGETVSNFNLANDGVEFFCHAPFAEHVDEGKDFRNDAALIFRIRFEVLGVQTNYLAVGDSEDHVLEDIVRISEYYNRADRLKWDLFNIPHHCSHNALNSYDKGEKETIPNPWVKRLLLHGQKDAYLVSSSKPIPDNAAAYEQKQPPHIQSRKCYERYLREINGRRFLVTMEEPSTSKPQPLEFHITSEGVNLKKEPTHISIISSPAPRAG
jgi:hypothetical protein